MSSAYIENLFYLGTVSGITLSLAVNFQDRDAWMSSQEIDDTE